MEPLSISVVIPAYNAGSFIGTAIESALAQTFGLLEIIVIDDGSKDDTLKVASSYPSPVRALTKANGGPASARNKGVLEARGEWIAFLDADDAWLPQKLEKQVELIGPDVGIVHCRARGIPTLTPVEINFSQLWGQNYIVNSSVLLRRAAFSQCGGFDEDPVLIGVEDYNLWLRVVAAGWRVLGVQEELCVYAPATGSLSSQTLRFASAGLANVRKLSKQLQLSAEQVRQKEIYIYDVCGRDLLSARDLKNARNFFQASLRRGFTLKRLMFLGAAYAPKRLLDWRRSVRAAARSS